MDHHAVPGPVCWQIRLMGQISEWLMLSPNLTVVQSLIWRTVLIGGGSARLATKLDLFDRLLCHKQQAPGKYIFFHHTVGVVFPFCNAFWAQKSSSEECQLVPQGLQLIWTMLWYSATLRSSCSIFGSRVWPIGKNKLNCQPRQVWVCWATVTHLGKSSSSAG